MTHPIHYSAARILIGFAFVGIATCNAATITVTSLADSGSGSLRAAVTSAAAGDTININTTGTLTFAAGESVKYISVPLTDDSVLETPETLTITLANPVDLVLGSVSTHTLTITDDDSPVVTITANDASASESGDAGQFTLTRTGIPRMHSSSLSPAPAQRPIRPTTRPSPPRRQF